MTNSGSNTVSVIDGITDEVKKGDQNRQFSERGSRQTILRVLIRVYVATLLTNTIYSIDGVKEKLETNENFTAGSIHSDIVTDPRLIVIIPGIRPF